MQTQTLTILYDVPPTIIKTGIPQHQIADQPPLKKSIHLNHT